MYVDDATIQDRQDARGRGQGHFRGVAQSSGFPMSEAKTRKTEGEQDFIGFVHQVGQAAGKGVVKFRPRESEWPRGAETVYTTCI